MHRTVRWGALVAVVGGACALARAAEYDDDGVRLPPGHAAFNKWGGHLPQPKPATPPPTAADAAAAAAKRRAADTAAAVRAQEEANLLRRLAVCDRVKQIAMETGDDRLQAQAEAMERKAEDVYKQRTAHLPFSKTVAANN